MRTREEQIEELVKNNESDLCHADYSPDDLRMFLNAAIQEAELRVLATIGADSVRLDWWEEHLPDTEVTCTLEGRTYALRWSAKSKKRGRGKTLRDAIDDGCKKSGWRV
ncbi:hypothetical protein HK16_10735 [Acetobacter senegalensis]|uniref:Uncharacterized protein n=2 Tax=Acetobacter TaxID=434 RepID=A0A252EJ04_9PROT|nr:MULTISPECIES: hypothetical protein [Acetobacter]ATJ89406.1 hypothetical protein CIW82_00410 [Acetobacter tropicalis]OUL66346.1 hypothetical protein HK16_10735 [Acetobacter senegalensis]